MTQHSLSTSSWQNEQDHLDHQQKREKEKMNEFYEKNNGSAQTNTRNNNKKKKKKRKPGKVEDGGVVVLEEESSTPMVARRNSSFAASSVGPSSCPVDFEGGDDYNRQEEMITRESPFNKKKVVTTSGKNGKVVIKRVKSSDDDQKSVAGTTRSSPARIMKNKEEAEKNFVEKASKQKKPGVVIIKDDSLLYSSSKEDDWDKSSNSNVEADLEKSWGSMPSWMVKIREGKNVPSSEDEDEYNDSWEQSDAGPFSSDKFMDDLKADASERGCQGLEKFERKLKEYENDMRDSFSSSDESSFRRNRPHLWGGWKSERSLGSFDSPPSQKKERRKSSGELALAKSASIMAAREEANSECNDDASTSRAKKRLMVARTLGARVGETLSTERTRIKNSARSLSSMSSSMLSRDDDTDRERYSAALARKQRAAQGGRRVYQVVPTLDVGGGNNDNGPDGPVEDDCCDDIPLESEAGVEQVITTPHDGSVIISSPHNTPGLEPPATQELGSPTTQSDNNEADDGANNGLIVATAITADAARTVVPTDAETYIKAEPLSNKERWFLFFRQRRFFVYLCLLLLLVGGIVSSIFIVMTKNASRKGAPLDMASSLLTPSLSPTISAMPTRDTTTMRNILSAYSDIDALKDQTSPQYAAMIWILNTDQLGITHQNTHFVQRYAAVVLYFATSEPTNTGITVEDATVSPKNNNDDNSGQGWIFMDSWLDPTKHECDWGAGLLCEIYANDNFVISLDLSKNGLAGVLPPEIGLFEKLVDLTLNDNALRGPIPDSIGNLGSLATLSISSNGFTGSIPRTIEGISDTTSLDMSRNKLNGTIPEELYNLSTLRKIDLSYNRFTGSISPSIGKLGVLTSLIAVGNELTGSIPPDITYLKNVAFIHIDDNLLTGRFDTFPGGPTRFGIFVGRIEEFTLSRNLLTGSLPTDDLLKGRNLNFFELFRLKKLDMSHNLLTGSFPWFMGLISTLRYFDMGYNSLVGPIPTTMGDGGYAKDIAYISFSHNLFNGTIPIIGSSKRTKVIDLSHNQLEGGIPTSLRNLEALDALILENNNLKGTIPTELGEMESLGNVHLSNCWLTGSLPKELVKNSVLKALDLSSNSLSYSIPNEIGSASSLNVLNLEQNKFSGTVPSVIGNLAKLKYLRLSQNNFQGSVPEGVCDLKNEASLLEISVDSTVTCDCC